MKSLVRSISYKLITPRNSGGDHGDLCLSPLDQSSESIAPEVFAKDSAVVQVLVAKLEERIVTDKEDDNAAKEVITEVLMNDVGNNHDPDAQFALGARYQAIEDYANALKFYLLAAAQMHSASMNNIGILVNQGKGTRKDESFALKWFHLASNLGNLRSTLNYCMIRILPANPQKNLNRAEGFEMLSDLKEKLESKGDEFQTSPRNRAFLRSVYNNLGCMYCRGMGTESDNEKARQMFQKAAELDSAVAKYNIGVLYLNGLGVKVNAETANMWFEASKEDPTHPDVNVINGAMDSSKLLMLTTLISN